MTRLTQSDAGQPPGPPLHHTLGFAGAALIVLFTIVLLPLAFGSAISEIIQPPKRSIFPIIPAPSPLPADYVRLRLRMESLDEWAGTVTLHATGVGVCQTTCDGLRASLVALPVSPDQGVSSPSAALTAPGKASEVTQEITLPVSGEPVRYPFDHYSLDVGILAERVSPDGTIQPLSAADAAGHLFLTLDARLPQIRVTNAEQLAPEELPANPDGPPYVAGVRLEFTRPLYLQVLAVLLVLLIASASAFAVFMRPVQELFLSSGALILGVWGVRSILLGSTLPGLTAVDFALSAVVLFLLAAIAIRAFLYMERLVGNPVKHLLPGKRPVPDEQHAAPARWSSRD